MDKEKVLDVLLDLAREAGKLQLSFREPYIKRNARVPHTLTEEGAITSQADLLSNRFLIERISALVPSIKVISKEQDEAINRGIIAKHQTYWLLDPLDHTVAYLHGEDHFAIHIALMEDKAATLGVVYFPALDTFYFTDGSGNAYKINSGKEPQRLPIASPLDADIESVLEVRGAMRACLVAEGIALSCSQPEGIKPWSIAALSTILRACGATIFSQDGMHLDLYHLDALPAHFIAAPTVTDMVVSSTVSRS